MNLESLAVNLGCYPFDFVP